MKKAIIIALSCVLVFTIGIIFLKYRPKKKNYNTQTFIMTNHLEDIDIEKIMELGSFRIYVEENCSIERYQELKNHHIEYFGIIYDKADMKKFDDSKMDGYCYYNKQEGQLDLKAIKDIKEETTKKIDVYSSYYPNDLKELKQICDRLIIDNLNCIDNIKKNKIEFGFLIRIEEGNYNTFNSDYISAVKKYNNAFYKGYYDFLGDSDD